MDERALVAIMAAIIYAGGDDNEKCSGYTPKSAVDRARAILDEAYPRPLIGSNVMQRGEDR
jgi:hypothetical protein